MSEMNHCPELGPCPDSYTVTKPTDCLLSWSLPSVVRRGGRYSVSATLNLDFPEGENPNPGLCQGTVLLPGRGKVWHNGVFGVNSGLGSLQLPSASHTFVVETDPFPDITCPAWEQATIHSPFGTGYDISRCVLFLPSIPLAPDEEDRATKDIPCPVNELLDGLGFTGLNGCAILQQLIDMLLSTPLSLGGFGGLLMRYLSDLFQRDPGSMGWGWQMNLYQRIEERESVRHKPDLVYHDGTGSFERWEWRDDAYVPAHRNNYARLETNLSPADDADDESPDTRWYYRLVFQDQTVLEFDYPSYRGRLLRRVDPHIEDEVTRQVTFHYNSGFDGRLDTIRDGFGRALRISHDAQNNDGQPSSVQVRYSDTDWKVVDFEYDANRRLSAIVGPYTGPGKAPTEAERTSFTYHDGSAGAGVGKLKQVTGPAGTILVRFDYYPEGANAGKVHTERLHLPAGSPEGKGQRRNTYVYDTDMRRVIIQVEDFGDYEPRNASRTYLVEYDERFNVTRTQDPLGNATLYEYGDVRDPYLVTRVSVLGVNDPLPRTTTFTYNSQGLVTSVEDAETNVTRMDYFGLETPTSNLLAKNQLAWLHRPEEITVFRNGVRDTASYDPVEFRYDDYGNLHQVVHQLPGQPNLATTLLRNRHGQVEKVIDRDGHTVTFGYKPKGNLETVTTPGTPGETTYQSLITTLLYEHPTRFARVTGIRYPWGTPWSYSYDEQERLTQATIAEGEFRGFYTKFLYEKGRLKEVLAPPNRHSVSDLAPRGGEDTYRKTRYEYDVASRLESVFSEVRPQVEELRVKFRHDGLDQLREMVRKIQIEDATVDQVTTYSYDDLGRLTLSTDPRNKPSRVRLSAFCRETEYVSAAGRSTKVTMDSLCRLASVSYGKDGDTVFEHDQLHRLIRVQQPGGTPARYGSGLYGASRYSDLSAQLEARTYEYDALDRLVRVNFPGDLFIRYEYTRAGRLKTVRDVHDRETHYAYYDDGRLKEVRLGEALFQYRYDGFGRLKCLVYPSTTGIVAHYTWTPGGALESLDYRQVQATGTTPPCDEPTGTSLRRLTYAYDAAGNRVNMVDSADDGRVTTTWEYWYDAFNRLEWVCQDGQPVRRYRFDQSDNRSELQFFENGVPKETHVYRYELGDRLTRVSLGPGALFHFEYDDDGNTVLREEVGKRTDDYSWSDAGALKSIRTSVPGQPDAVMRNEYDAGRIRKRKLGDDLTQTDYYYSGLPALSETLSPPEGEPSKRSYVVGHQVLGYFEGDSFRLFLPDALGSVRELVGSDGSVHARYTYDEYGNEIAQATAFFSGALGVKEEQNLNYMRQRWNDPTHGRFLSKDPLSTLDRYGFANNNPILYVDPTGLAGEEAGIWEPPIIPDKLNKQPFQNRRDKAASRLEWAIRLVELYAKRHGGRYADEAAAVRSYSKSPVSNILLPIKEFGEGPKDAVTWRFGRCMEFSGRLTVPDIDETHPSLRNFDADDLRFLASTVVHEGHHAVNPNATEDLAAWVGNEALSRFNEFTSSLTKEDWDLIYRGVGPITTSIGPDPLSQ